MKKENGFDHIIGENNSKMTAQDLKVYQRIIQAHSAEQSIENKRSVQHIGLQLEMEDYLQSENSPIKPAGSFLERLLKIYSIKKSECAQFVEIERTNFYALLKGRRKFNNVIASKIGEIFNIDPQLWMFIEAKNEMKEYRHKNRTDSKEYSLVNLLKQR